MKLYCLLATSLLFLLPAISLLYDKSGKLCWFLCSFYLFCHLFFKKYVYTFHKLDKINHKINVQVL